MLATLISYPFLILLMVAALCCAERLLALRWLSRAGGSGSTEMDAAYDFDRAWAQHRRRRLVAVLTGRAQQLQLPLLDRAAPAGSRPVRCLGERSVPLASIVGSVDGAAGLFDRDFRPADRRARARLKSVLVAVRRGDVLPPVQLYQLRGDHYVLDGHHRVAAARALGEDHLAARVTELG